MNLQLTEEQELVIAMVRRFVRDEILPLEYDLDPDADELNPTDRARLIEKTKEMGLYGLDIPPAFGGPDIDLVTRTLIAVEMAQHRAGLYAPCYGTFGGAGLAQLFEATEEQKEKVFVPYAALVKSAVSLVCRSPLAVRTRRVRFKPRQFRTATTGLSMAASCGSAGRIKPNMDWCLRVPRMTKAAMVSPALSWIPTRLGSPYAASYIPCEARITRQNSALKTCGCQRAIFWVS